jgi:hypothetical protein
MGCAAPRPVNNHRLSQLQSPQHPRLPVSARAQRSHKRRSALPKQHGLQGFQPTDLSFVDAGTGYLLGYAATGGFFARLSPRALLARTDDGGRSWHRLPAPPVSGQGDEEGYASITFVSPDVGFVLGRHTYVTTDAAAHWRRLHTELRIVDLEYGAGRIWALAHPCRHCHHVRLYSATLGDPTLRLVRNGPRFRRGGAYFIHGSGDELYIVKAPKEIHGILWRSYRGRSWTRQREPCSSFGSFAAWSEAGVAAVCNVILFGEGQETKRAYVSFDGAHTWTRRGAPGSGGYIGELAAGSSNDWVLGEERIAFLTTVDDGGSWLYTGPSVGLDDGVGDTQFTSLTHVVAIPSINPDRVFMYSDDAGQTWSVHRFPIWSRHRPH